jgi:stage II sporulation protein D
LSDRAVWSTRGEILTWKGDPIVALYTATCGGHTEDGGEIFPEHDGPYLKGVPCRAEAEAVATLGATVKGRTIPVVIDETGADVTRDWTLLQAAGIVPEESSATAERAIEAAVLRNWTATLARRAGLPAPPGDGPGKVDTLGRAAAALLLDLGWTERARVLVAREDVSALLRDPTTAALAEDQRRALAYLAWLEAVRPFPEGGFRPDQPATGARLAPALVRIGESYRAFGLKPATVAGVGAGGLRLVRGKGSVKLPVAPDAALFTRSGGRATARAGIELWPGDSVRYRTGSAGTIDFLEVQPPIKGTSDDRSARVYSWEVRKTRRQVEQAINRRVSVGRLEGFEIVRRGVSGRIVELRVVGSRSSAVVVGFDVRRLLDLRESLLVIEPQRGADGTIEAVVFAGKGWGHGVGLCQVGAYGMALRGADYAEILAHYYRGSRIEPLDLRRP